MTAAITGLGANGAAYLANIYRAGIDAVDRGQREAALSLGLTPTAVLLEVVLPQAVRIMIPPFCNHAIQLLKDTSLVSAVAAPEIMFRARRLVMETYLSMHVYLLVAVIYLACTIPARPSRRADRAPASGGAARLDGRVPAEPGDEPAGVAAAAAGGLRRDAAADGCLVPAGSAGRRRGGAAAALGQLRAAGAAVVYVEIARGMPALVILFLIYFALPTALPALQFDSFTAACIGLGLQGAALLGEIFRAGLEAVDRGQREAALTLGLTPRQSLLYVVAPQAVRVALAPTGNYVIGLLKDTSIASIIAAPDLMLRAKDLASSSFLPMQLYVLAAILYFAMSWPLARLVRRLELAYAAPHRP